MPRHRVTSSAPAALLSGLLLLGACGSPESTQGTSTTTSPGGAGGTSTTTAGGSGGSAAGSGGATGGSGGATGGSSTGGATGGATAGGTGGAGGQSLCGNGMIDSGEDCEGSDLAGATCMSLGFPGGTLACSAACHFDLGNCTGSDDCTDGSDNDGDGKTDCQEAECASACADACFAPVPMVDADDRSGSNAGHANVLVPSCVAASGPEVVYAVTALETGVLDVTLIENGDAPFSLSIRSVCGDDASEIACTSVYAAGAPDQKKLSVPATAGQTLFVVVDGDGAAAEGSYTIVTSGHPVMCGDGAQDPPEACDDGGTVNGDGCSAACTVESKETEPNGTLATAAAFSTPWYAEIDPEGDVDWVQITWPTAAGMAVSTDGIGDGKCTDGSMDTVVTILDSGGNALATNDDHAGACSLATVTNLAAGTYYARIEAPAGAAPAAATFPYVLSVTPFHCGDGSVSVGEECDDGNQTPGDGCDAACKVEVNETEPNGTTALADVYASPWIARIDPDGDIDVVSVTVPGPGSKITATTTDPTGGAGCAGPIDTFVEILKAGDVVLASNDDANGNYCSVAVAGNLPAGTYYVRVQATPLLGQSNVYIFTYKLNVKVE